MRDGNTYRANRSRPGNWKLWQRAPAVTDRSFKGDIYANASRTFPLVRYNGVVVVGAYQRARDRVAPQHRQHDRVR